MPTTDLLMPRLSDSMEEGTVASWLRAVGDDVVTGQDLVEIETDKATVTHEADASGTLLAILVAEGETAAVGARIAVVGDPGDELPATAAAASPAASAPPATQSDSDDRAAAAPGRPKASPVAARLAREHGIDLLGVQGSGPGGRIVKADVAALIDAPVAAPPAATPSAAAPQAAADGAKGDARLVELTSVQRTVARRMVESANAPAFQLDCEIDMSRLVDARTQLKSRAGDGLVPSFNDFVVKATALALREHPTANGSFRDEGFEVYSRINVGIAVAHPGVLMVPTIFDADRKGVREIAVEARRLAASVRDGSITPAELSGGTFTVSNLGMHGVTRFDAIVNSPQAAILAVGAIRERPVAVDGELAIGHLMGVTLACDHRILYGSDAALLLSRIKTLLEEPLGLAL